MPHLPVRFVHGPVQCAKRRGTRKVLSYLRGTRKNPPFSVYCGTSVQTLPFSKGPGEKRRDMDGSHDDHFPREGFTQHYHQPHGSLPSLQILSYHPPRQAAALYMPTAVHRPRSATTAFVIRGQELKNEKQCILLGLAHIVQRLVSDSLRPATPRRLQCRAPTSTSCNKNTQTQASAHDRR